MTMHFRALADQAMADGEISAADVLSLSRDGWSDGRIDATEADALFVVNDHLKDSSAEWAEFFAEAVVEFIISNGAPRGYVSETQAEWLIGHIAADGRLDGVAELDMLGQLFDKAVSLPGNLKTFALGEIERAVLTGEGATRDGEAAAIGSINSAECRLLRRFVFAAGGDGPASVSKSEAELLFRLKDATIGADNAPEWKQLFVQGVGNYLQGFGGDEPLSAQRAAELENFMNDTAVGIGGFFGRMARSDPRDGVRKLFQPDEAVVDSDAEAAEAANLTADEKLWLQSLMDADGRLDELEQALLDFLAEV